MSAKPIKPSEVAERKVADFPDGVIEAFNELIAENFSGGRAVVQQKDLVRRIKQKMRSLVFEPCWLNAESIYEKAGWVVEYDKPGYNETYGAFFTFKKRR